MLSRPLAVTATIFCCRSCPVPGTMLAECRNSAGESLLLDTFDAVIRQGCTQDHKLVVAVVIPDSIFFYTALPSMCCWRMYAADLPFCSIRFGCSLCCYPLPLVLAPLLIFIKPCFCLCYSCSAWLCRTCPGAKRMPSRTASSCWTS